MECYSDAQDSSVITSSSFIDADIDNLCLFTDQVDIDDIIFDFPPFELSGQEEFSSDLSGAAAGKMDHFVEKQVGTKAMPLPQSSTHQGNTASCNIMLKRAYRIVEESVVAKERGIKLRAMDLKLDRKRQQRGIKRRQSAETRSYRLKLMAQRLLRTWDPPQSTRND